VGVEVVDEDPGDVRGGAAWERFPSSSKTITEQLATWNSIDRWPPSSPSGSGPAGSKPNASRKTAGRGGRFVAL